MLYQMAQAKAEFKDMERQRKAARDARARAAQTGESSATPAPVAPTHLSPDGQPVQRTLVVCPLAVVRRVVQHARQLLLSQQPQPIACMSCSQGCRSMLWAMIASPPVLAPMPKIGADRLADQLCYSKL